MAADTRIETESEDSLPAGLERQSSRRQFLRGLAGASAAMGLAAGGAGRAAPPAAQAQTAPPAGLPGLRRWAASGDQWSALRRHFLLGPRVSHLNTGSLGATPRAVVDAHARYLREIEANPVPLLFGSMGAKMEDVRSTAARFLGADPNEMMLTANTTSGMNLVARALRLQPGDEVLTSNHEHPGGRVCWDALAAEAGVSLREINFDSVRSEADILSAISAALTSRTKVVSLSHVSTINGLRLPVAAIARLAHQHGAFLVVDGAQSAGMLEIDLHALGCDAFATSGHKWMLAPKGTGLLYLRREFQPHLRDVVLSSGPGAYTAATGTRNVPQILAQGVAINFLETIGRARIEARALELAACVRQQLPRIEGVELASPAARELQSAIVTATLPPQGRGPARAKPSAAAVCRQLQEQHNIVVKPVPADHLDGRGIRISTHFYNTPAEVDSLVRHLRAIIDKS